MLLLLPRKCGEYYKIEFTEKNDFVFVAVKIQQKSILKTCFEEGSMKKWQKHNDTAYLVTISIECWSTQIFPSSVIETFSQVSDIIIRRIYLLADEKKNLLMS